MKFPQEWPWWSYAGISWGMFAFFEYVFANQAKSLGEHFDLIELKSIQVLAAVIAYVVFSYFVLNEKLTLQHLGGFALIASGAGLIFPTSKLRTSHLHPFIRF